ncbi:hypothetical protein [Rhodococcus rhodochrous]|uniref:hypothetical protein n=1 Tax=Rhodococcus rhodochrous TaxID=1829 RepID=UPI000A9B952C|nr:hypothetical protein [Rhodococcus rhodochrous]
MVTGPAEFLAAESALIEALTGTASWRRQWPDALGGNRVDGNVDAQRDEGPVGGEPVVNHVATLIAKAHGLIWQWYVGAVVFTSVDDEGGGAEPA